MSQRSKRGVFITLLVMATLSGCAGAYILSVLWRGGWRYHELIAPVIGTSLATLAFLLAAAIILRGQQGARSVIAFTAVLGLRCGLVVLGVFFGLLENCHFSCGETVRQEVISPTGRWKAVWLSTDCASVTRVCARVSHVSIVDAHNATLGGEANALVITPGDGLRLQWEADDELQIDYWGFDRVLRRRVRVGDVKIVIRPIGLM
jgi:hypothetical protein